MKTLGQKIRELRVVKRFTQDDLATHLGVVKATVSAWEHGLSRPNIDKIKMIAEFFEMDLEYFRDNVQVLDFPLQDFGTKQECEVCKEKDMIIEMLKERIADLKETIEILRTKSY